LVLGRLRLHWLVLPLMESKPVLERSAQSVGQFEPHAVECSKDIFAPIAFPILVFLVVHLLRQMERYSVLIRRVWGAARPSRFPLILRGRSRRRSPRMVTSSAVILVFAVKPLNSQ